MMITCEKCGAIKGREIMRVEGSELWAYSEQLPELVWRDSCGRVIKFNRHRHKSLPVLRLKVVFVGGLCRYCWYHERFELEF